jgi:hypothetical protein
MQDDKAMLSHFQSLATRPLYAVHDMVAPKKSAQSFMGAYLAAQSRSVLTSLRAHADSVADA